MERGGAVRHEPPPPAACFQEQLAGHGLEIGDLRRGLARAEEELARVDVLRDVVDINVRPPRLGYSKEKRKYTNVHTLAHPQAG